MTKSISDAIGAMRDENEAVRGTAQTLQASLGVLVQSTLDLQETKSELAAMMKPRPFPPTPPPQLSSPQYGTPMQYLGGPQPSYLPAGLAPVAMKNENFSALHSFADKHGVPTSPLRKRNRYGLSLPPCRSWARPAPSLDEISLSFFSFFAFRYLADVGRQKCFCWSSLVAT